MRYEILKISSPRYFGKESDELTEVVDTIGPPQDAYAEVDRLAALPKDPNSNMLVRYSYRPIGG